MAIGLIGKKCGMTRVFTDEGASVPVTVIEVEPNRVIQVKTPETDGYAAVQVTAVTAAAIASPAPWRATSPRPAPGSAGGCGNSGWTASTKTGFPGAEFGVDLFEAGQRVDVRGTSKGKGFAGTIKRWNFRGQDNSHGNSISHRAPGSIGQCQTPGRVFKGKKMAGQLGNVRMTTQNLEVVRVDKARNLLLVKGAVPGPQGGDVQIRPAIKAAAS